MRTVRAAVDHRERLLRGEQPQPQQRHSHAEDRAEQHIGRRVHTQPHPGQANHRDDHGRGPAAAAPPPAGRHQRVQRAGQHGAHLLDLNRRHAEASPAKLDQHPERQRPVHDKQENRRQQGEHLIADDQHQQMPEPAQHDQRQQQQISRDDRRRRRARLSDHPGDHRETRNRRAGHPPGHGVVDHRDIDRPAAQTAGEHRDGRAGRDDRDRQPDISAALDVPRQRRRRTRRAAPAAGRQHRHPRRRALGRPRRATAHTYPRCRRNRQDGQPGRMPTPSMLPHLLGEPPTARLLP